MKIQSVECRKFLKLVRKPSLTSGHFGRQKKLHRIGKNCLEIYMTWSDLRTNFFFCLIEFVVLSEVLVQD